jgi:hypothetical protein
VAAAAGWAAGSGGRLDHDFSGGGGAGRARAAEARGLPPALGRWVRAGVVKAPGRAAEKALACYGGDPSRLLDVCRCRLVFDDPAGLAACLDLAGRTPGVRPVRLRGGLLPPGMQGSAAGPFRAVVLAVRRDSDAARALGVDGHVCEVRPRPARPTRPDPD